MLQQLEGESEELAREKLPAARRALRRTFDGIRRYELPSPAAKLDEAIEAAEMELLPETSPAQDSLEAGEEEESTLQSSFTRLCKATRECQILRRCVEQGGEVPVHFVCYAERRHLWRV